MSAAEFFRQLLDGDFAQGQGMADALEFGAGALGVFDGEMAQGAGGSRLAGGRQSLQAESPRATGIR